MTEPTEQPKMSREEAEKVADEYFNTTEQPNQIIFEQIEGCCDIIENLLNELIPKTTRAEDCMITHKSWRDNNLKHLRKAFE